jgi:hypothetical protein
MLPEPGLAAQEPVTLPVAVAVEASKGPTRGAGTVSRYGLSPLARA